VLCRYVSRRADLGCSLNTFVVVYDQVELYEMESEIVQISLANTIASVNLCLIPSSLNCSAALQIFSHKSEGMKAGFVFSVLVVSCIECLGGP